MYSSSGRQRGGGGSAGTTIILGGAGKGGGGGAAEGAARIFTRSLRGVAGDAAHGFVTAGGRERTVAGLAVGARTMSIAGAAKAAARSPYSPVGRERSRKEATEGQWGHDMFDPFDGECFARNKQNATSRGAMWAGRAARASQEDLSKRKLTIENLHYEVLDDDIKELFGSFGTVVKAVVHYDRSGRSTGRADVTFGDAGDAKSALHALNNRLLDGQPMQIKYYEPPPRRQSGLYSFGRSEKKGDIFDRLGDSKPAQFGGSGARGGRRDFRSNAQPVTVEDLDADMDAYMKS